MPSLYLRPTAEGDVERVVSRLAPSDRHSLALQTLDPLPKAVAESVGASKPHGFTICAAMDPVGLLGVVPQTLEYSDDKAAVIWCFVTEECRKKYGMELSRSGKRWLDDLMEHFDVIHNIEYAMNNEHIRWLEFCGFQVMKRITHGPYKAPFVHVMRRRRKLRSEAKCLT